MVAKVIAEYLLSNRKLVVPAFGAFVVKETGELAFTNLLNENDGVLASLLRDKGLNEMEAAVTIDRFIFEVRHELEQYGYCCLGELGTMRLEPDTNVLRMYPPVTGELPKETNYVPTPIDDEVAEQPQVVVEEVVTEPVAEPQVGELQFDFSAPEEAQVETEEPVKIEESEVADEPLEEPLEETIEEIIEESAEEPAEEPVEEPTEEIAEVAVEESTNEVVEEPVQTEETEPKAVKPKFDLVQLLKRMDPVMMVAAFIILVALVAICYGIYVSTLS